jgi:hypothetical protein
LVLRVAVPFHSATEVDVGSGDVYRRFAAECFLISEHTHDAKRKAALLAMASAWHKLAEFVDRAAVSALTPQEREDAP